MSEQLRPRRQIHRLELEPGEYWWGGAVSDGQAMPFGDRAHRRDLAVNAGFVDDPVRGPNQSAPLLVSSAGRYLWSERPFSFAFDGAGGLEVAGEEVIVGQDGVALASAYRSAAGRFFPPSGRSPAAMMFAAPQDNTWIEMPYHPTQQAVTDYARGVLAAGFPPGVIMIDDRWSVDYGVWTFDPARFPRPAEMIEELHDLGFSVMLWLVPFLSPDSSNSRMAARRGWLVRGPDGREVVREWWNGYSTVLDLTQADGVDWLRDQLAALQTLGVDGFKVDAGDVHFYRADDMRRVLDERHLVAVRAAVDLRQSLLPEIMSLVRHAARTGEPILRALAYHWPGYESVHDQFLLGETILVAPVLEAGARVRQVAVPPGQWRDPEGTVHEGPAMIDLPVTLESLPWWRRVE